MKTFRPIHPRMSNIPGFALFLAALAVPLPGLAQKEAPPPVGPAKDVKLPAHRTFTLDNGMRVTLVPFGMIPMVALQLNINAGNINESAQQTWLADLTGKLMKEGTTTRTGQQVANEAASMGGAIAIAVTPDQTIVNSEVLSERAANMARLIGDVVLHPRFPDSELGRIKADLARQMAIQKTVAQSQADEKFQATLYPNHPYGRTFPTEAMLSGYRIDQVRKFYGDNFSPQRAHLMIAGVFDGAAVERAVREAFSPWKRGVTPANVEVPAGPETRAITLVDRPDAPQSTIRLGLRVPGPSAADYIPLRVADYLLGGSFNSRVTTNIREDKGYSYSPGSFVLARQKSTYWNQTADVTTKDTGNSLKEIFAEIDRLSKEAPGATELRGIQNQMAGIFLLQTSSRTGIIGQLNFADLHGVGDAYLTNYVKNVMAVTPAQVQRMTQTYLRPEKMTLIVVGDKKTVSDQLAPWSTCRPQVC